MVLATSADQGIPRPTIPWRRHLRKRIAPTVTPALLVRRFELALTFCHGSIHWLDTDGQTASFPGKASKVRTVSPMAISPARKHLRLSAQVFETIREEIVSGQLSSNVQISEAELSERLGVSRTPVREALIKLAEDGLVQIVPQVGTFVAPISVESVKEAQFIREQLECALIVEAAQRIDQPTVRRLRDNLIEQDHAARDNDWERFYVLDESFHSLLAGVAGHPTVWRVIQQSKVHMDRVRHVSFRMPDHMTQLIAQHNAIVDAVADGNGANAQEALRHHLREIFGTLEKLGLANAREATAVPRPRESRG
ncbi:GntR family transcriptional regulator [Telmatospirillum sp.]|uniref:GntR family transcriptional regulator n=1 Tax=Telmatospirillum sp. TaxID=2079197 RepID=UPI0028529362|nr:GntR family transcriptional regulator [Telmatospirillum sp.]